MKRKILFGLAIILLAATPIITNTAIAEELHTSELQKDSISTTTTEQETKAEEEAKAKAKAAAKVKAEEAKKVKSTKQQNLKESDVKKAQVKNVLVPSATAGFTIDFTGLAGSAVKYNNGIKFNNAVLIDITTDENYKLEFKITDHDTYQDKLTYGIAFTNVPETEVSFGELISIDFAKGFSHRDTGGSSSGNYNIALKVYGPDPIDEIDSGHIRVNKQRNTAEITLDKKENPSTITFENEGNSEDSTKTYAWTIVDKDGKVILEGTGTSVPSDKLEDLPEGDYTVNLTTNGESQYGNAVQEKTDTDTFTITFGTLIEVHYIKDADGNVTEEKKVVTRKKIGATYETEALDIPGYKLVEKPSNASGKYSEEDTLVEYYYEIIKPNLIVKYVDENGKELNKPIKSKGVYGEDYATDEKEFEGYELVAIPSNASGTFGEKDVTVTYVYRLIESKLTVQYVDEDGNQLHKDISSKGGYGESYTTDEKEFEGYELVAIPSNATGEFALDDITVIYVYRLIEEGGGGDEGSGENEGSETGSGEDPDEAVPGTPGSTETQAPVSQLVETYQAGQMGDLPQTGTGNVLTTGLVGGLLSFIGVLILIIRRKSQNA